MAAGDAWLVGCVPRLEQLCAEAQAGAATQLAEERRRAEESAATRERLQALPATRLDTACEQSWDGLAELVSELLGGDAWERTLMHVPDEWEEEQALESIGDALRRADASPHFWLLLSAGPQGGAAAAAGGAPSSAVEASADGNAAAVAERVAQSV